jgi:hypothetical protein
MGSYNHTTIIKNVKSNLTKRKRTKISKKEISTIRCKIDKSYKNIIEYLQIILSDVLKGKINPDNLVEVLDLCDDVKIYIEIILYHEAKVPYDQTIVDKLFKEFVYNNLAYRDFIEQVIVFGTIQINLKK